MLRNSTLTSLLILLSAQAASGQTLTTPFTIKEATDEKLLLIGGKLELVQMNVGSPVGGCQNHIFNGMAHELMAANLLTDPNNPPLPNGMGGPSVMDALDNWKIVLNMAGKNSNTNCCDLSGTLPSQAGASFSVTTASLHEPAPHAPAHNEMPNNMLPFTQATKDTILVGQEFQVTGWANSAHGTKDHDAVAITGSIKNQVTPGNCSILSQRTIIVNEIEVMARHGKKLVRRVSSSLHPSRKGFGSTVATCAYDATMGKLSFSSSQIDVLDNVGGNSGTVAPQYAADIFQAGEIQVDNLFFAGVQDGISMFEGGTISVHHPGDQVAQFAFNANITNLMVGDTTLPGTSGDMESFGVLHEGGLWSDVENSSDFLLAFADDNVLNTDKNGQVIFSFTTNQELAMLTNGFTSSVTGVPVTIVVSGVTLRLDDANSPSTTSVPTFLPITSVPATASLYNGTAINLDTMVASTAVIGETWTASLTPQPTRAPGPWIILMRSSASAGPIFDLGTFLSLPPAGISEVLVGPGSIATFFPPTHGGGGSPSNFSASVPPLPSLIAMPWFAQSIVFGDLPAGSGILDPWFSSAASGIVGAF